MAVLVFSDGGVVPLFLREGWLSTPCWFGHGYECEPLVDGGLERGFWDSFLHRDLLLSEAFFCGILVPDTWYLDFW